MKKRGSFIISLDLELLWGVQDHEDVKTYGSRILGGRRAIPEILSLFEQYEIHATWAVVGFLFAKSKEEMRSYFPSVLPGYQKPGLSNYAYMDAAGETEEEDPYHYGLSLIRRISGTAEQEIATHTFSHYYCCEEGQSGEDFERDLISALRIAGEKGYGISTIVFPRNQVNPSYLGILEKHGIRAYRGEDRGRIYRGPERLWKRALRLLDAYLGFVGGHCCREEEIRMKNSLCNIRAGAFLRPYSERLKRLERIRLFQIRRRMRRAARRGEIFHLWFHPHNFGENTGKNLENLKNLLEYYRTLRQRYGFCSRTMGELAGIVQFMDPEHSRRSETC